ncbi:MAG: hypothetical protein WCV88_03345 [Patescibacteria group bacterium]|jgi:hypothetical protein
MMRTRSLKYLYLCGLVLLFGCAKAEPDNVSDTCEQVDTSVADTATDYDQIDYGANYEQGQQYDYWIEQMDQFITKQENWTFTFDQTAFLESIKDSYPAVYEYYVNDGPDTNDTVVIDALISGLPTANEVALEEYEFYQEALENGGHMWVSNASYWWGRQSCFGGGDANWMLSVMRYSGSAASTIGRYVGAPAWLINAYLSAMVSSASSCNSRKGYFCISYSYSGFMWISC